MLDQTPATKALDLLGLPYTVFRHTQAVASLEQAAGERGQTPAQVIRSILFRLGEDNFVMALMAGPAQISWPILHKTLGQSRLTMASEEEVLSVTGYRIGAVSPLGLPQRLRAAGIAHGQHEAARLLHQLRILADESVFVPEEISIGSGERGVAILLRSADLKKALAGLEIGQFSA